MATRTGIPVEIKLNVHQRLAGGGYGSRGDEAGLA